MEHLAHFGVKGMKWKEKKNKPLPQQNLGLALPAKLQALLDQLTTVKITATPAKAESVEKAKLFVVKKSKTSLSDLLSGTGNGKVELKGYTKVNTKETKSNNGKVILKGYTKK